MIICKTIVNPESYRILMLHACKKNKRGQKRRKILFVSSLLLIIYGVYDVSLLLRSPGSVTVLNVCVILLLFLVALYTLWFAKFGMILFACRTAIKLIFKDLTVPELAIDYQFTDDGIHWEMDESSNFSPWTVVEGFHEDDRYFYYKTRRGGYQFIDKDGFEQGELEKFRILIKDKLRVE